MASKPKHIVIDARIRRASTGRPVERLLDQLQSLDTENLYTILTEPDDPWQPTAKNFIQLDCGYRQFSFSPIEQIGFAWLLYKLKPDLVHFTMTQQPLLYFGNIITMTHDLTMLNYTRPSRFSPLTHKIGMVLYRFLLWWSHRRARHIIVPTQFVAKDIRRYHHFTKNKIAVIYEAGEPPLDINSDAVPDIQKSFIMHLGAPFPHKNIDRLMRAFEILKKNYPDLSLVLPGKMRDEFKKDFESWLSLNKYKESIIAPGFVTDGQLKWLYENAEAYVLPSLSEGFGLPGLEAMVNGCPVVSSNATCLPEVYGDAAHYFDPTDINDIALKINEVLSDNSLRSRLIAHGSKQVAKYSWRRMAEQTLDVYNTVLGNEDRR